MLSEKIPLKQLDSATRKTQIELERSFLLLQALHSN